MPEDRKIVFELCAETLDACLAARDGGAHRIELCSALSAGGLTPSHGLIRLAVDRSGLPVHVMVRPRAGDFVYSPTELDTMREDILHLKQLGVAGIVLGLLHPDATVDIPTTRQLIALARPLQVTFHRAFDAAPSLRQALDDVLATGADRILTSGGQSDVVSGTSSLAELILRAAGRIDIAVGGGLRLENADSVGRLTGATHFHGSLRPGLTPHLDAGTVRAMIDRLQTP